MFNKKCLFIQSGRVMSIEVCALNNLWPQMCPLITNWKLCHDAWAIQPSAVTSRPLPGWGPVLYSRRRDRPRLVSSSVQHQGHFIVAKLCEERQWSGSGGNLHHQSYHSNQVSTRTPPPPPGPHSQTQQKHSNTCYMYGISKQLPTR